MGGGPDEIARAVAAALQCALTEMRKEQLDAVGRLEEPLNHVKAEMAALRSDVEALKARQA